MRNGVPVLLDIFRRHDVKASFFVPMGKDNTGRTVKRVFTRKGFLKKAGRVGVLSTYGVRTLRYGLLLPGPQIARRNIALLKRILDDGNELGIHGPDHVRWHDSIKYFDEAETRREIDRLLAVYRMVVGEEARSFAAPGWMINPFALRVFEERGLVYSSDTRGVCPFYPEMGGTRFSIVQIPTTLPTLDEVIGVVSAEEKTPRRPLPYPPGQRPQHPDGSHRARRQTLERLSRRFSHGGQRTRLHLQASHGHSP